MARPQRVAPGPGQESVWDYPRPPRVEDSTQHVQVLFDGQIVADTQRARRVLETSHPPVYYIPLDDVRHDLLRMNRHATFCEFKGRAGYYDLNVGARHVTSVAWFYPDPAPGFEQIRNYVAFYPSRVDACLVDGEVVQSQEGDFYGGWITRNIVGPFKGGAGTTGW